VKERYEFSHSIFKEIYYKIEKTESLKNAQNGKIENVADSV
jgi:hypothetical protein